MNIQETALSHQLNPKEYNSETEQYLSLKKADASISKSELSEKDEHGYSKTIQDLGGDNLTHSSNENAILRYCQNIKKDVSWDSEHSLDFQQPICNLQVHGCYPNRELKEIIPPKTQMFVEAKLIHDHDRCNKGKTSHVSKALNPDKYQCSGLKDTETLMKCLHIQDSHIQDLKQKVFQEESRRIPSQQSKTENPSSRSHQTMPANEYASANDSHRCYYQENAYGDYWRGSWDKDLLDSRISETGCSVACIQNERERATHQLRANTTSLQLGKVTSQKMIISGCKEIVNRSKELITTRSLKYQPKNTMTIQETALPYPLISKEYNSKTRLYLSLKKADASISKSELSEKDEHGYSKTIQYQGGDNLAHSSNENVVLRYCQNIKKDISWDCEHSLDFQQPIHILQGPGCYPKREPKEIILPKTQMFVEAKLICDHDRCNKGKTSHVSKSLNPDKYQCSALKETETLMKCLHIQDSHIQDLKQKVFQEESRRMPSQQSKGENPSSRSNQTMPANEYKFNKNSNKRKIASKTKTSPENKHGSGIKRHCAQAPGLNYLDTSTESLQKIRQNIRHHQAQKNARPEKHDNSNRSQRDATINSSGSDSNAKKRLHTKDKTQRNAHPPWH